MRLIHQHYDYEYKYDTVQLVQLSDLSEFLWAAFWAMNLYIHSLYTYLCSYLPLHGCMCGCYQSLQTSMLYGWNVLNMCNPLPPSLLLPSLIVNAWVGWGLIVPGVGFWWVIYIYTVQAIVKKFLVKKFSIWHPDFLINFSRVWCLESIS